MQTRLEDEEGFLPVPRLHTSGPPSEENPYELFIALDPKTLSKYTDDDVVEAAMRHFKVTSDTWYFEANTAALVDYIKLGSLMEGQTAGSPSLFWFRFSNLYHHQIGCSRIECVGFADNLELDKHVNDQITKRDKTDDEIYGYMCNKHETRETGLTLRWNLEEREKEPQSDIVHATSGDPPTNPVDDFYDHDEYWDIDDEAIKAVEEARSAQENYAETDDVEVTVGGGSRRENRPRTTTIGLIVGRGKTTKGGRQVYSHHPSTSNRFHHHAEDWPLCRGWSMEDQVQNPRSEMKSGDMFKQGCRPGHVPVFVENLVYTLAFSYLHELSHSGKSKRDTALESTRAGRIASLFAGMSELVEKRVEDEQDKRTDTKGDKRWSIFSRPRTVGTVRNFLMGLRPSVGNASPAASELSKDSGGNRSRTRQSGRFGRR